MKNKSFYRGMGWVDEDTPYFGPVGAAIGAGTEDEPEPRLWFAKSVPAGPARAMAKKSAAPDTSIPMGFHKPWR